ncbi:MAG: PKD domain-containing protein [Bacteroidia bacterium]|nr:PKD domain-containing protein [Bacteroidia bacterium]
MMKSLIILSFCLLFGLNLFAQECLLVEIPLTQRVALSDLVVEAEVIQTHSAWDPAHRTIFTEYTLAVNAILKGNLAGTQLKFIQEGGQVAGEKLEIYPAPNLFHGQKGIYFLDHVSGNAMTGVKNISTWAMSVGPQSVIYYDLRLKKGFTPFITFNGLGAARSAVAQISTQNQQVGSGNFLNVGPGAYPPPPSISSFSPTTLTAGTQTVLTINGNGFGGSPGQVTFPTANAGGGPVSALPSQILSWSNTQITLEVPASAGTGIFSVVSGVGGTSNSPSTLTIDYNHLNVSSGGFAFQNRHRNDNGAGGITWHYNNTFATNANATASFERALSTWRCNTFINWDIGANTNIATNAADGVNTCFWSTSLPPGVLGVCWSFYGSCQNGGNTEWFVTNLDIAFQPNFTWQFGPAMPASNEFDFETVALHELGHGHQLGHVINTLAPMHASVAPGVAKRNLLASCEIAGGLYVMTRSTGTMACGPGPMTALNSSNCGLGAPTADFSGTPLTVCTGSTVSFTDQSLGNPTSWAWTFPGGTPGTSALQNPTITYNTPGTYAVTLVASNAIGNSTETKAGYITVGPPTAVISGNANIVAGNGAFLHFDLTGTPPWNFSYTDGTTTFNVTGVTSSPHYIYVSPIISTTYTLTAFSDANCTGTFSGTAQVNVAPQPPISTGLGIKHWVMGSINPSICSVVDWSGPTGSTVPFGGNGGAGAGAAAMNECGQVEFYLLYSDNPGPNQLFCVRPNGTVLNPGNGMNGRASASSEMSVIRVPETSNQYYVIYSNYDASVYTPANIYYSKIKFECDILSFLVKDQPLLDGNNVMQTYTHGQALSKSTPGNPYDHFLYLCRRNTSSLTSLDRFVVDKNSIQWDANTGNVSVPYWNLTISGSPIELNWQQNKLAVIYRNQSANLTDLIIWDANLFSNAVGAYQMVSLGSLILQPDPAGIVLTPASVQSIGFSNNQVFFLRNLEKKVQDIEFSPSGQYLYFTGGGYVAGNFNNVTYLGQIDLNTPYPYAVRLQAQSPPGMVYNSTSGQGCNFTASVTCDTTNRPIAGIQSSYDGHFYFQKRRSDTLFVIPSPDAPLPQFLTPHQVDLSTSLVPNIKLAGGGTFVLPDQIDGYDYSVDGVTVKIKVDIQGCMGCVASTTPQVMSLVSSGGGEKLCMVFANCPDSNLVCVNPDSVYHLYYQGNIIQNAVVGGATTVSPFVFNINYPVNVYVDPVPPSLCDTALPVNLSGWPAGGVFSGTGVVGNTFDPTLAGIGNHWIKYTYTDPVSGCQSADSTLGVVIHCCPSGMIALLNTTDETCAGDGDGSVFLGQLIGIPPFQYSIDGINWQNSGNFTGLSSGSYMGYVTDSAGCMDSVAFVIGSPPAVGFGSSLLGNVSCFGGNNGAVTFGASAGTPPFQFSANNITWQNSNQFSGLAAGVHTFWLQDGNGCKTSTTITLTQPLQLVLSTANVVQPTCGENNGLITLTATGGTGQYQYGYVGGALTFSPNFANLSPGSYDFQVQDVNGCISTLNVQLNSNGDVNGVISQIKPETCEGDADGSLTMTATAGTPPFTYSMDGINFQNSGTFSNLGPGGYTLWVKDANGCLLSKFATVSPGNNPLALFGLDLDPCRLPFDMQVINHSKDALNYSWNFGDGNQSTQFEPAHTFANAGNFTVSLTVSDALGCTDFHSESISLTEPPIAAFASDPAIPAEIWIEDALVIFQNQSQNANNYVWTFGDGNYSREENPDHRYKETGEYCVGLIARNEAGCQDTATQCLITIVRGNVFFPTAFTPNEDHNNDEFRGYTFLEFASWDLQIFDRWGMLIFEGKSQTDAWDGRFHDQHVQEGVYAWTFHGVARNGKKVDRSGTVTLLR